MTMEHRWSERKPIEMQVALYYAPIGTIVGKTEDISLEGMFVRTATADPLPLHAEVEVSFVTSNGDSRQEHRMPAYVVHHKDEGMGLMLRHVDYGDFYALRYLLSAA